MGKVLPAIFDNILLISSRTGCQFDKSTRSFTPLIIGLGNYRYILYSGVSMNHPLHFDG